MGFTKLDSGIVDSSVWSEPLATRVLWITLLAKANHEGFVSASRSGLIRAANIPEDEFNKAIAALEKPDPDSRSSEHDGRRIERVEGGWLVLNYKRYREFTYSKHPEAIRKKKYRDKTGHVPNSAGHSASASVSENLFNKFWLIYPRKVNKAQAIKAWSKIKDPERTFKLIVKALSWQIKLKDWLKEDGQFIPHPSSYLNGMRWEDEFIPANVERAVSEEKHSPHEVLDDDAYDQFKKKAKRDAKKGVGEPETAPEIAKILDSFKLKSVDEQIGSADEGQGK